MLANLLTSTFAVKESSIATLIKKSKGQNILDSGKAIDIALGVDTATVRAATAAELVRMSEIDSISIPTVGGFISSSGKNRIFDPTTSRSRKVRNAKVQKENIAPPTAEGSRSGVSSVRNNNEPDSRNIQLDTLAASIKSTSDSFSSNSQQDPRDTNQSPSR